AEGNFIESYYLVGLLARHLLARYPGGKVLHDVRLTWNTIDMVQAAGGVPVRNKTGHAFMKEAMRREGAVYGGEMSAHHYFMDFNHCDSGMLPWLKILEILEKTGRDLGGLVLERIGAFPCSGEINFRVKDAQDCMERIRSFYALEIAAEDHLDGLSADCGQWRFNLRSSNTEPLLRLNVESRGSLALMSDKTSQLEELIAQCGGEKTNA
ncbi:MAG: phosphomannomutase, partial [Deltaproteobacteria bacterium]|nr:phosphomannomutase [Deltaproteobacteria bacterium]